MTVLAIQGLSDSAGSIEIDAGQRININQLGLEHDITNDVVRSRGPTSSSAYANKLLLCRSAGQLMPSDKFSIDRRRDRKRGEGTGKGRERG